MAVDVESPTAVDGDGRAKIAKGTAIASLEDAAVHGCAAAIGVGACERQVSSIGRDRRVTGDDFVEHQSARARLADVLVDFATATGEGEAASGIGDIKGPGAGRVVDPDVPGGGFGTSASEAQRGGVIQGQPLAADVAGGTGHGADLEHAAIDRGAAGVVAHPGDGHGARAVLDDALAAGGFGDRRAHEEVRRRRAVRHIEGDARRATIRPHADAPADGRAAGAGVGVDGGIDPLQLRPVRVAHAAITLQGAAGHVDPAADVPDVHRAGRCHHPAIDIQSRHHRPALPAKAGTVAQHRDRAPGIHCETVPKEAVAAVGDILQGASVHRRATRVLAPDERELAGSVFGERARAPVVHQSPVDRDIEAVGVDDRTGRADADVVANAPAARIPDLDEVAAVGRGPEGAAVEHHAVVAQARPRRRGRLDVGRGKRAACEEHTHGDPAPEDGVVNAIGRRDRAARDEEAPPGVGRADPVRGEGATRDLHDAPVDRHVADDVHVIGEGERNVARSVVVIGLHRQVAIDRQRRAREGTGEVGIAKAKGEVPCGDRLGESDRAGVRVEKRVIRLGVAPSGYSAPVVIDGVPVRSGSSIPR